MEYMHGSEQVTVYSNLLGKKAVISSEKNNVNVCNMKQDSQNVQRIPPWHNYNIHVLPVMKKLIKRLKWPKQENQTQNLNIKSQVR